MKWKIIIILMIILSFNNLNAYAQGWGHCKWGHFKWGHCVIIPPTPEPSRGGGGVSSLRPPPLFIEGLDLIEEITTPYYDVVINLLKNIYKEGENIESIITIINKGDIPDNDAILTYYIIINNKTIIGGREVFEEVPIGTSTFQRSINIPNNELGKGLFVVEYETIIQPRIQVYTNFLVINKINYGIIFPAIIVLMVIYLILITPIKIKILKKIKRLKD